MKTKVLQRVPCGGKKVRKLNNQLMFSIPYPFQFQDFNYLQNIAQYISQAKKNNNNNNYKSFKLKSLQIAIKLCILNRLLLLIEFSVPSILAIDMLKVTFRNKTKVNFH